MHHMDPFQPPSAAQFADWLDENTLTPPPAWLRFVPVIAGGGVLLLWVLSMQLTGPIGLALPWLGLGGVLFWLQRQTSRNRMLQFAVERVHELAGLRWRADALREGWKVLPGLTHRPVLWGRTVAVMSHLLSDVGEHEAAWEGLRRLVPAVEANSPIGMHLRISLALACLRTDRLTEANEWLRSVPEQAAMPDSLKALRAQAELVQQALMHQVIDVAEDVIREGDGYTQRYRGLGIEAGYVYGLVAWCLDEAAKHIDEPSKRLVLKQERETWWERATLLMPESAIVHAFPRTAALAKGVDDGS